MSHRSDSHLVATVTVLLTLAVCFVGAVGWMVWDALGVVVKWVAG